MKQAGVSLVFLCLAFIYGGVEIGQTQAARVVTADPGKLPNMAFQQPKRTSKPAELNGDVFIVTKSGLNYKLGLVTVALVSADKMEAQFKKGLAEIETALNTSYNQKINDARVRVKTTDAANYTLLMRFADDPSKPGLKEASMAAADEAISAKSALRSLYDDLDKSMKGYFFTPPEPVAIDKSDADGKFTLQAPPGKYFVVGTASRVVGSDTESYEWAVPVTLVEDKPLRLMLSNDNNGPPTCAGVCGETVQKLVSLVHDAITEKDK